MSPGSRDGDCARDIAWGDAVSSGCSATRQRLFGAPRVSGGPDAGGRSRVEIDPYTGDVVFAEGSRTAPAGTRGIILNRAIHTGDIFGITSKIVMSLASALTPVMAISGFLTWCSRLRAQR